MFHSYGHYQPHLQLSSERELCERFKVSWMTVRQAITEMLSRLRMSNDVPLAIETSHLPYTVCPKILQHDFATESLYHVLESE